MIFSFWFVDDTKLSERPGKCNITAKYIIIGETM